jgi:hypothetical protein
MLGVIIKSVTLNVGCYKCRYAKCCYTESRSTGEMIGGAVTKRERERERERDVFSMLDRKWRKYSTCGVYSLKIERSKEVIGEKTESKNKREE